MTRLRVTFRNGQRTTFDADATAAELSMMVMAPAWPTETPGWLYSDDDATAFRCDDVILIETVDDAPKPAATPRESFWAPEVVS